VQVTDAPVRVIAFNMLGHWADDVSRQIAEEIQERCDLAGEPIPEYIRDFVEDHTGPTRRLALHSLERGTTTRNSGAVCGLFGVK
jgi:hypothetical protein